MKLLIIFILLQFNTTHYTGVVEYYNETKGFGYIIDDKTKDTFYVYEESIIDEITKSDFIIYEVRNTRKGYEAFNVRLKTKKL